MSGATFKLREPKGRRHDRRCSFAWCTTLALVAGLLSSSGCMLVMDADFSKYHYQQNAETTGEDASVDVDAEATPDGGLPVDAGLDTATEQPPVDVVTEQVGHDASSGTCFDHIKNQDETGVDCGGVCPPCEPVGFFHHENFDHAPDVWGPDGEYQAAGKCDDAVATYGWVISDFIPDEFSKASGQLATISSGDSLVACDDIMSSPKLQTHGATSVTIDFDSNFRVDVDSEASVWLVLDGGQGVKVWQAKQTALDQHVHIGPIDIDGAQTVRVVFHYEAYLEYYWDVDNIVVAGK